MTQFILHYVVRTFTSFFFIYLFFVFLYGNSWREIFILYFFFPFFFLPPPPNTLIIFSLCPFYIIFLHSPPPPRFYFRVPPKIFILLRFFGTASVECASSNKCKNKILSGNILEFVERRVAALRWLSRFSFRFR